MILVVRGGLMRQEGYLDSNGQPIVKEPVDPKKMIQKIAIIVFVILIVIFIGVFLYKKSKNDKCYSIEDAYKNAALQIAEQKKKLPKIEGQKVTITEDEIEQSGKINKESVTLKENVCKGSVTITNVKGKYISVANLTNCDYCTTDTHYKKASKYTDKEPGKHDQVEVKTTYNYYTFDVYYTKYSNWIKEEKVNKTLDKKFGIYMPQDSDVIPDVPEPGKVITIEQEKKNTYSYRDKRWLYYRVANDNYSAYSNEPVAGYANKDISTKITSAASDWSPNYPDKKSYRMISTKTGYRWYKKVNGKKVYWKSGKYYPEMPEKGYTKDESKKVSLYSYKDSLYRYYNGQKRGYGGFSSKVPTRYPYRDDDSMTYTTWSGYYDVSHIDGSNNWYREERINVNSRYRVKYKIYSVLHLDSYVTEEELQKKTGKTLEQLKSEPNVELKVKYEYRYRKVK